MLKLRYGKMITLNLIVSRDRLQAVSADSKTRKFLLQGSRTTSSMTNMSIDPGVTSSLDAVFIAKDVRSYSDEVLLKPNYLPVSKRSALIRRNAFKVSSNRIAPASIAKFK